MTMRTLGLLLAQNAFRQGNITYNGYIQKRPEMAIKMKIVLKEKLCLETHYHEK